MRLFSIICMLFLFMTVTVVGQEDTDTFNRLPELLAQVPDTEASRQFFSFADYEAMTLARPDAVTPSNREDFESDESQYQQWVSALSGIYSGVELQYAGEWIRSSDEYMGFTFFNMNTSVVYGMPPEEVILLIADYDVDDVIEAHENRDFELVEENDDYTFICGIDGCDTGQTVSIIDAYRGYVFGGHLGREQPVLLTGDNLILSSAHLPAVEIHINMITEEVSTLADNPDYAAIAEVSAMGVDFVIQGDIRPVSEITLNNSDTDSNLPTYDVFAIVDGTTLTEQVVRVMFVYDNEDDAQLASDELVSSIAEFTFGSNSVSLEELIAERGATYDISVVSTDNQERYVTVIELLAPLETELGNSSGLIYQLLYQVIDNGNTGWLAPNLDE